MFLPPVVERELRVAARRSTLMWGRLLAAGGAALVFASLAFAMSRGGPTGPGFGTTLFTVLQGLLLFRFSSAIASAHGFYLVSVGVHLAGVLKDLGFFWWARRSLLRDFRTMASRE